MLHCHPIGKMQHCNRSKAERIISANVLSRRLGISRAAVGKYVRRGLIIPDFRSDCGDFFRPERIAEFQKTISDNRQRHWQHLGDTTVGSVTFSTSATRLKALAFQDALAAAGVGNTPEASLAYVTTPSVSSKWMTISEVTNGPKFLWDGNEWAGMVAGYPEGYSPPDPSR
jgi:hypothetical protein